MKLMKEYSLKDGPKKIKNGIQFELPDGFKSIEIHMDMLILCEIKPLEFIASLEQVMVGERLSGFMEMLTSNSYKYWIHANNKVEMI